MLEVKNLSVRYGDYLILDRVNFSVQTGDWLMLVGPNGAGKSTLAGAVAQGVPYTGTIALEGRDMRTFGPRERARAMGVLTQSHSVGYAFTVEEVVRLGRYAYGGGPLGSARQEDEDQVNRALALTGLEPFRRQSVLTVSGGELQRTFLAQIFAQNPRLLILDEPTNHLDLIYQRQVFALLKDWLAQGNRALVSVVHDLSLAKAYGTRALLLNRGRQAALGAAAEVLTREGLEAVYGMDVYAWMRTLLSQWQEDA